ncbi:MAG TPA: type II toxin-antitoxin system VapC family toxin [Spirochaetota bacterium]|nr:type II toxin-antitoxin system VapC family toxin [Spirochaetota bacterium]HPF07597.1 type II toxin-antitoxin system VapC family toxin [Spirochaetota bacterium]HPJ44274.1 type II toxin-antitoxin system VapC family toxin [Spirochaetota bacterium]HRX49151.1 type II toxin-antitoxin system VapC family toxin [Spirochaetota bacterium]
MNYLIDTNIIIWYLESNEKLPVEIRNAITNADNDIFISIVSFWEIAIKYSLGRLDFPKPLNEIFDELSDNDYFKILPLKQNHILTMTALPYIHRDPFDRLIYSQARSENIKFLYTDEIFNKYEKDIK